MNINIVELSDFIAKQMKVLAEREATDRLLGTMDGLQLVISFLNKKADEINDGMEKQYGKK